MKNGSSYPFPWKMTYFTNDIPLVIFFTRKIKRQKIQILFQSLLLFSLPTSPVWEQKIVLLKNNEVIQKRASRIVLEVMEIEIFNPFSFIVIILLFLFA